MVSGSYSLNSKISIHALREEGDTEPLAEGGDDGIFLSTPSVRRATWTTKASESEVVEFLSTPSVRRATKRAQP